MEIKCAKCNLNIVHNCHSDLLSAAKSLYSWAPNQLGDDEMHAAFVAHGERSEWLAKGEDPGKEPYPSPFFGSQAWSYALFGNKDDARTFHALIDNLVRAAGLDPDSIRDKACDDVSAQNEESKRRSRRHQMVVFWRQKLSEADRLVFMGTPDLIKTMILGLTEEAYSDLIDLAKLDVERMDLKATAQGFWDGLSDAQKASGQASPDSLAELCVGLSRRLCWAVEEIAAKTKETV